IHAPSAIPRALWSLFPQEVVNRVAYSVIVRGPTKLPQTLDNARGHIRRGRIEHCVVIGEWNVVKEGPVVVAIKCAPASVHILHGDHPTDAEPHGMVQSELVRIGHALESHQHECGIVDVGVKIVSKFESPSTRLRIAILDLPVASIDDLLVQKPTRRLDD